MLVATLVLEFVLLGTACCSAQTPAAAASDPFETGVFHWATGEPVWGPKADALPGGPTAVRYEGKWHVFGSPVGGPHAAALSYAAASEWTEMPAASIQPIAKGSFFESSPQVFYFRPHGKWYLFSLAMLRGSKGQAFDQVVYRTTDNIADPASWSAPIPVADTANIRRVPLWSSFSVICDDNSAHLFLLGWPPNMPTIPTAFNRKPFGLYHASAPLTAFPTGFGACRLALKQNASRSGRACSVYRMAGDPRYLALFANSQLKRGPGFPLSWTLAAAFLESSRRYSYLTAYVADSLDGKWQPLAASRKKPFIGQANMDAAGWATGVAYGRLIPQTSDERCEVDPRELQLLFMGVLDPRHKLHLTAPLGLNDYDDTSPILLGLGLATMEP